MNRFGLNTAIIVIALLISACGTSNLSISTNAVAPNSPLEAPFESPLSAPFQSPLQPPLPLPVFPEVTTEADTGALMGFVITTSGLSARPLIDTAVRLGAIQWTPSADNDASEKGDGVFVIEGGSSPGALTDASGVFVIRDLVPGDYVMAVGDLIGQHEFIIDENGEDAKVFSVEAGSVLNVGTIQVSLP